MGGGCAGVCLLPRPCGMSTDSRHRMERLSIIHVPDDGRMHEAFACCSGQSPVQRMVNFERKRPPLVHVHAVCGGSDVWRRACLIFPDRPLHSYRQSRCRSCRCPPSRLLPKPPPYKIGLDENGRRRRSGEGLPAGCVVAEFFPHVPVPSPGMPVEQDVELRAVVFMDRVT